LLDAVRERRARDAVRSAIEKLGGKSTPAPAAPSEAPAPASTTPQEILPAAPAAQAE
jgi:hypothetical protein